MDLKIQHDDSLIEEMKPIARWPFMKMEVGDFVKVDRYETWLPACRAAQSTGKRKGWKFMTRWKADAKSIGSDGQEYPDPYGKIIRVK